MLRKKKRRKKKGKISTVWRTFIEELIGVVLDPILDRFWGHFGTSRAPKIKKNVIKHRVRFQNRCLIDLGVIFVRFWSDVGSDFLMILVIKSRVRFENRFSIDFGSMCGRFWIDFGSISD